MIAAVVAVDQFIPLVAFAEPRLPWPAAILVVALFFIHKGGEGAAANAFHVLGAVKHAVFDRRGAGLRMFKPTGGGR